MNTKDTIATMEEATTPKVEKIQAEPFRKLDDDEKSYYIDWSWTVATGSKSFGGKPVEQDGEVGFLDRDGTFHPNGEVWYGRIKYDPPTTTAEAVKQLGEETALDLLLKGLRADTQNTGKYVPGSSGRQGHQASLGYFGEKGGKVAAQVKERLDLAAGRISKSLGISLAKAMDIVMGTESK